MSRVDEIFAKIGQDQASTAAPFVNHGNPDDAMQGARYRLTKKAIMKVLATMPDEAALWGASGLGEYDAKSSIKEALWGALDSHVTKMVYAPDGKTLLEAQ